MLHFLLKSYLILRKNIILIRCTNPPKILDFLCSFHYYTRKKVTYDSLFSNSNFGSCKYRNEKIGLDELTLLQEYASVFGKGSKYHYFIFSKGGFTDNLLQAQEQGKVTLITLVDMYRNSDATKYGAKC